MSAERTAYDVMDPADDGELTAADLEHVVGGVSMDWFAVSDEEGAAAEW